MPNLKLDILVIDTHDVHTLGIADVSYYPTGMSVVNPTIQITPPSHPQITIPFTYSNLSIYNSNTLGITCTDEECGLIPLPDGIYKVKYTITPADTRKIEKTFIRTEQIQHQLGVAFLSTDLNSCAGKIKLIQKEQLNDIMNLIQGAIADASNCNEIAAMNKYHLAISLLRNFKNC